MTQMRSEVSTTDYTDWEKTPGRDRPKNIRAIRVIRGSK